MKTAIMQPYFMPYIGYFQLINAVDKFVIYDNIKYTKKGWINRNRILVNGKDQYISLPLKKDSDYLNINEAARDYPEIQEIEIGENPSLFLEMLDKINAMPKSIPLFTKSKDGTLENIPVNKSEINIEDCEKLVYLGEKIK